MYYGTTDAIPFNCLTCQRNKMLHQTDSLHDMKDIMYCMDCSHNEGKRKETMGTEKKEREKRRK